MRSLCRLRLCEGPPGANCAEICLPLLAILTAGRVNPFVSEAGTTLEMQGRIGLSRLVETTRLAYFTLLSPPQADECFFQIDDIIVR